VFIGIVIGLAHLLKSTAAVLALLLVAVYSCLFGVLGCQEYTRKRHRDGWPSGKRSVLGRGLAQGEKDSGSNKSDDTGPDGSDRKCKDADL